MNHWLLNRRIIKFTCLLVLIAWAEITMMVMIDSPATGGVPWSFMILLTTAITCTVSGWWWLRRTKSEEEQRLIKKMKSEVQKVFEDHTNQGTKVLDVANAILAFRKLYLRVTTLQVQHMLTCVQQCVGSDVDGFQLGDFRLMVNNLRRQTCSVSMEPIRTNHRSSYPVQSSHYDVFLGGACNPTTWRKESAIPYLTKRNITFYNPQVDEWSPELIEIEQQAKQNAHLLLFVLDPKSRGIASMVEIAYLAGAGRNVIVVIRDFDKNSELDSQPLTENEIEDLNRGHDLICAVCSKNNVPLFENLESALDFTASVFEKDNVSQRVHKDAMLPLIRGIDVTSTTYAAYDTFRHYDSGSSGFLSIGEIRLAIRSLTDVSMTEPEIYTAHGGIADRFNFSEFCGILSELMTDSETGNTFANIGRQIFKTMGLEVSCSNESSNNTLARDVFLGGSCHPESTWRQSQALPFLREHGLSYFNPQIDGWNASYLPMESHAKQTCSVLLYVVSPTNRSIGAMIEAAHFLGEGREIVLVVNEIKPNVDLDGEQLTKAQVQDLNRGRAYLIATANQCGKPVFSDVDSALQSLLLARK